MKKVRNFSHLPNADQLLLIRTAILLGAIRLGLILLPFQTLQQLLAKPGTSPKPHENAYDDRSRIVWAISKMALNILRDKPCLTQALAVQFLFSRRGYPAELCIGVAKNGSNQLQAHAWVESEGKIVIGGADSPAHFKKLSPFTEPVT